jgi:hypothetical protein
VVFRPKLMPPEELYRGWLEVRKEAYSWPSIFSRVRKNPGRRFTNLIYNILRKGPNDRLKKEQRRDEGPDSVSPGERGAKALLPPPARLP